MPGRPSDQFVVDAAALGRRIAALRSDRRLTRGDLRDVGLSPETVRAFERGRTLPSLDSFVRLARKFGVSLDDLLGSTAVARSASSASPAEVHGGAERAASGCTHVEQAGATSGLHAGTTPAVAATQGGAAGLLDQPGRAAERDTTSASDAEVGRLATAS